MLLQNPERAKILTAKPRPDLIRPLAKVKREAVESALILCEGDKRLAANQLGISYHSLLTYCRGFRNEN